MFKMKRSHSCLEYEMSVLGKRHGSELAHEMKRQRVPLTLGKRCGDALVGSGKRCRTGEEGALQRMLADAYREIHALREELKQAKMEVDFYQRRMNLPYNHDITCY